MKVKWEKHIPYKCALFVTLHERGKKIQILKSNL